MEFSIEVVEHRFAKPRHHIVHASTDEEAILRAQSFLPACDAEEGVVRVYAYGEPGPIWTASLAGSAPLGCARTFSWPSA